MPGEHRDTDTQLDAIARGLGAAQADAKEAATLLRGSPTRPGVLTDIELLKTDLRHVDDRLTETRELFLSMFRQLDTKIDVLTAAVRAMSSRTLHPLVTALLVACVVTLATSAVVVAGIATQAYAHALERERYER